MLTIPELKIIAKRAKRYIGKNYDAGSWYYGGDTVGITQAVKLANKGIITKG